MTEQGRFGQIEEYIQDLKAKAEASQAAAADYKLQAEFLVGAKEILERYGQLPLAMQTTQFIIEQITAAVSTDSGATAEEPPSESSERVDKVNLGEGLTRLRPRARRVAPRMGEERDRKYYNIAPQVKPIMSAIFGSGSGEVPETLNSLFDKMYPGQDWHSRTIRVPRGIGMGHQTVTYADDLNSPESYIRHLVRGADRIIGTKMRSNSTPAFAFRGRVAATELIQLYHTIDSVGWDIYDQFMIGNRIRQT